MSATRRACFRAARIGWNSSFARPGLSSLVVLLSFIGVAVTASIPSGNVLAVYLHLVLQQTLWASMRLSIVAAIVCWVWEIYQMKGTKRTRWTSN